MGHQQSALHGILPVNCRLQSQQLPSNIHFPPNPQTSVLHLLADHAHSHYRLAHRSGVLFTCTGRGKTGIEYFPAVDLYFASDAVLEIHE